jgi:hypothetical protein
MVGRSRTRPCEAGESHFVFSISDVVSTSITVDVDNPIELSDNQIAQAWTMPKLQFDLLVAIPGHMEER